MVFYQIDAFTKNKFGGNPAAVTLLPSEQQPAYNSTWMQQIANEFNLSETAFLEVTGNNIFNLRWFTPQIEVDLCGHATLASAHALWQHYDFSTKKTLFFNTKSGQLSANYNEENGKINMLFPATPAHTNIDKTNSLQKSIYEALHISEGSCVSIQRNISDILIELSCESLVHNLQPNFAALLQIPSRGIIVTAKATQTADKQKVDFISRFFGPNVGINEDPVTGSAHCTLGPYWANKLNKNKLIAYQASKRGGFVDIVMLPDKKVQLSGNAVSVMRCELL